MLIHLAHLLHYIEISNMTCVSESMGLASLSGESECQKDCLESSSPVCLSYCEPWTPTSLAC